MKITAIETVPIDQYLFVKVHTDEDITGYGERSPGGEVNKRGGAAGSQFGLL